MMDSTSSSPRKFSVALAGMFCAFASACMFTSVEKPISSSTPSSLSLQPVTDDDRATPMPTPSPALNVTLPPNTDFSPTPTAGPTYPPEVVAKNLSFVDWPEYGGVQYFRGKGKGIYSCGGSHTSPCDTNSAVLADSIEVEKKTGKLIANLDPLSTTGQGYNFPPNISYACSEKLNGIPCPVIAKQGAAEMSFEVLNGDEQWKFMQAGSPTQDYETINGRKYVDAAYFLSNGQEWLTERYNGAHYPIESYNESLKQLQLVAGFIPGSTESVIVNLAGIDNSILTPLATNAYGDNVYLKDIEFFARSITIGKRGLYLVLPDFSKQTLVIYSKLLPKLDQWRRFELSFVDKDYFDSNGKPVKLSNTIIALRYHAATNKLYLSFYSDNHVGFQLVKHYVPNGFIARLVRFSEDYVLR